MGIHYRVTFIEFRADAFHETLCPFEIRLDARSPK
jgi:hypothetical protein